MRLVYAAWSAWAWLSACGSDLSSTPDAGRASAGANNAAHDAGPARASKLDLLFVIDNSSSMKEEQAALRVAFPRLIKQLSSGDHDDDGQRDHVPVVDLHLGVVSSDLGADPKLRGCEALGDDGVLRHAGNPALEASLRCEAKYPSFLQYTSSSSVTELAQAFACITALGTAGCGFEQHLEAALKAVWPANQPELAFLSASELPAPGHGDRENAGFLRNVSGQAATLAVIVITDEDDCSSSDRAIFRIETAADAGNPYAAQALNLRCFYNHDKAFPIERYLFGFRHLGSRRTLFASIVGVPSELVDSAARSKVSFLDAKARDAHYDQLLADARMQEKIDPKSVGPAGATGELIPTCRSALGPAYPARRFVELAKRLGEDALIQSICNADLGPALDQIAAHVSEPSR